MRGPFLLLVMLAACRFDPDGLAGGDAGARDATVADAGRGDGGADAGRDGALVDGALVDGALVDGALLDAAPIDARPIDAAVPDAAVGFCDPNEVNLVACYRFENVAGQPQPHDESRYNNHGTASNASFVAGRDGQALSLGPASSVRVADSVSLDVALFTIEMWIHATTIPATGRAGLLDDDGQYGIFLMPAGEVHCSAGLSNNTSIAVDSLAGAITTGAWHHVACKYDGSLLTIYIDGRPQTIAAGGAPVIGSGTNGIAIGQNSPTGDNFEGLIDDLRIWRVARTPQQICIAAGTTCP